MKALFDIQNPWRNPGYKFPKESYIERSIFSQLLKDVDNKKITVIAGSRQVGKTFLLQKLIERILARKNVDPQQIFYFNFDSFELIELIKNDRNFLDFIKCYSLPKRRPFLFLDEVQRIPEVGLLLKRYFDLGLDMKFIVSGSSSLEIKGQVKETLAGRKHLFELYPITYEEFIRYKGFSTAHDLGKIIRFESDQYQRLMEEFILFGGYPGVVREESREDKMMLLKEIYTSYVQKDISDFLKIEDIAGFNRLVQFMAGQTGGLCKINEVAKNIRLSRHFVEKYLFALEETYVLAPLRPYFVNLGKAIIKSPKYYFCDSGIRNTVLGQFEPLEKRGDTGALVESFVFSELMKSVDKDRLWFYRTTAGSEADFLLFKGNHVIPIEVKYSTTRQRAVPKIFYTLDKHTGVSKGIVITKDHMGEEEREGMYVVFRPAWSVYRLDPAFWEDQ